MDKPLYLLFIILMLHSCNSSQNENSEKPKYFIVNQSELSIPIDVRDSYLSFANQVYGDSLYRFSKFEDVIDVYPLKSHSDLKKYRFDDIGPNHISAFQGAAIIKTGIDSFLIANNYSQLYITYKDSVLFKKNLIEEDLISGKEYRSFGINKLKPVGLGNNFFMVKFSQYNPGTDLFYNDKVLMYLNLDDKTIKECNISYPNEYKGFYWSGYHYMPSFTTTGQYIYISFPINEKVFVFNPSLNVIIDTLKASSKFIQENVEPLKTPLRGRQKTERYAKENVRYETINYEPNQKLFYRIIVLPVDNEMDLISHLESNTVSPFSVMILDQDFNVLAEEKFPGKTYDITDYFVTLEGLWISNNNPENPNFSEDKLSFTLFELAEKQE